MKVGDIVKVGGGSTLWELLANPKGWTRVRSLNTEVVREYQSYTLKLFQTKEDFEAQKKMGTKMKVKLYQIKNTETFATQIGVNQFGKLVLEVKGTGDVVLKDASEVVEVVPYTITTQKLTNNDRYFWVCSPEQVKLGDILIIGGNLTVVTAVDTKEEAAKPLPKGIKRLLTEIV